jgi:hypothetical protein
MPSMAKPPGWVNELEAARVRRAVGIICHVDPSFLDSLTPAERAVLPYMMGLKPAPWERPDVQ